MKAYESKIQDVFGKKYIIPDFQRPYRWDPEDAEQLVEDICECLGSGEDYFIGSIICIKSGNNSYEVIDGQQRLITFSILFLEMAKKIDDKEAKNDLQQMVGKVRPYSKPKEYVPSLQLQAPDHGFYLRHVINGEGKPASMSSRHKTFINNMERIGKFLSPQKFGQDELMELAEYIVERVFVVFVEVDDRDSAFRLFNVLNNRGMSLTQADLLKNELLSNAFGNLRIYEQVKVNWQKTEDLTGEDKLNGFLTVHQISEKKDRDRVKEKNYKYYRNLLTGSDSRFHGDSSAMSLMLCRSAEHYRAMLDGKYGAVRTVEFLDSLSKQEEWTPAFIAFLNKNEDKSKFPEFAKLFEKIYMHSVLSDDSKSKRDAACYHAVATINNGKSHNDIMAVLRSLSNNSRLEQSLAEDFYDVSRPRIINLVKSVLFRVETEQHDKGAPRPRSYPDSKNVHVEHILPQKNTDKYWTDRFTEQEHKEWLHKLGNLTLLEGKKGSAARNFGFDRKKNAYVDTHKTSFDITKRLCDLPEWNLSALKQRHESLKKDIMKLWQVKDLL